MKNPGKGGGVACVTGVLLLTLGLLLPGQFPAEGKQLTVPGDNPNNRPIDETYEPGEGTALLIGKTIVFRDLVQKPRTQIAPDEPRKTWFARIIGAEYSYTQSRSTVTYMVTYYVSCGSKYKGREIIEISHSGGSDTENWLVSFGPKCGQGVIDPANQIETEKIMVLSIEK